MADFVGTTFRGIARVQIYICSHFQPETSSAGPAVTTNFSTSLDLVVVLTHQAQRTHLMICQFIIGVAFVRTKHAGHARIASVSTIRMSFDAVRHAFGDIPSRGEGYRGRRACTDASPSAARGTWIEAYGGARTINFAVEQKRGAKRDPGSKHRVNNDSDNTRSGQSRYHCQLHKIQRRSASEWIYSNTPHACGLNWRRDLLLDNFTCEIVERIVAFEPARVFCGVGFKDAPEITAAIPDHHNRAASWTNGAGAVSWRRGEFVSFGRKCCDQIEPKPLNISGDVIKQIHLVNLYGSRPGAYSAQATVAGAVRYLSDAP